MVAIEISLLEAKNDQALSTAHSTMAAAFRRNFGGLISAYLVRTEDGSWADVTIWETEEQAVVAITNEQNVPQYRAYVSEISAVLSSRLYLTPPPS